MGGLAGTGSWDGGRGDLRPSCSPLCLIEVSSLKAVVSPGGVDGVWVASVARVRVRAEGVERWDVPTQGHQAGGQRGRPRGRSGDCVLYVSDVHRLYRLSPDPYSPCTVPTRPLSRQEHMSSTPSLPPPGDANEQAAADEAFLEEIGLHDVLEQGVVRLLEVCPRPSSLLEALRVLSAQMTRDIEALEGGGESKDAAAAETTLSMIVDTVVRVEAILHNREVVRIPRACCCPRACYFPNTTHNLPTTIFPPSHSPTYFRRSPHIPHTTPYLSLPTHRADRRQSPSPPT